MSMEANYRRVLSEATPNSPQRPELRDTEMAIHLMALCFVRAWQSRQPERGGCKLPSGATVIVDITVTGTDA